MSRTPDNTVLPMTREAWEAKWRTLLDVPHAANVVSFTGSQAVVLANHEIIKQLMLCMEEGRINVRQISAGEFVTADEVAFEDQIILVGELTASAFLDMANPIAPLERKLVDARSGLFFIEDAPGERRILDGQAWRRDRFHVFEVG